MHDDTIPENEEIEVEAIGIEVNAQPIELYKVLKIANVVSGGGEAKYAITDGYVAVNGELETRKRRKLYDGDLIEFNNDYYLVICDHPVNTSVKQKSVVANKAKTEKSKMSTKKQKSASNSVGASNKGKSKNKATIEAGIDGGRSRIHFGD